MLKIDHPKLVSFGFRCPLLVLALSLLSITTSPGFHHLQMLLVVKTWKSFDGQPGTYPKLQHDGQDYNPLFFQVTTAMVQLCITAHNMGHEKCVCGFEPLV